MINRTVSVRTSARNADGTDVGEWLQVVREANGIEPGVFGSPTHTGPWWAGGSVEDYPDARIIHRDDGSVSVVSVTERGTRAIAGAAAKLGIRVSY
jgi:hypothetical protein